MKIILASQSPFRKHALDILGLDYETIPSDFDESQIKNEIPSELVKILSEEKAKAIAMRVTNSIIISADLLVVHNNKIMGKPKDEDEAKLMIKSLSGETFEIMTGLAVCNTETKELLSTSEKCKIKFRNLSSFEIDNYVSRYPSTKCAGGFEADGLLRFAEHIEGSYNFKVAIPMDKLILFLRKNGIEV